MIYHKNYLFLFGFLLIANITTHAMEKYYQMTIKNELSHKIYLNVNDPNIITDKSPYCSIKNKKEKTFFVHLAEINSQSIAFPGGLSAQLQPKNKIALPINDREVTWFIVKRNENNKPIVVDNTNNGNILVDTIEWIISNPQ